MVRESRRVRAREENSSPVSFVHGQTTEDAIDLDSDIEQISDEEVERVEEDVNDAEEEDDVDAFAIASEEEENFNGGDQGEEENVEEEKEIQVVPEEREAEEDSDGGHGGENSVENKEDSLDGESTSLGSEESSLENEENDQEEKDAKKENNEEKVELDETEEEEVETPVPQFKKSSKFNVKAVENENLQDRVEEMIRDEIAAGLEEEISIAEEAADSADDVAILLVEPFSPNKKFLRKRKRKNKPDDVKKQKLNISEDDKAIEDYIPGSLDSESKDTEVFVDALSPGEELLLEDLTDHTSAENLPHFPEVIEIESETEETVAPKSDLATTGSAIRLLYNSSYDLSDLDERKEVNLDTVTINELVGQKDLEETYQFNFNVDLEYFLSFLHPDFSKDRRKITFITGNSLLSEHPLHNEMKKKFNISDVIVSLPNRFASHHSKMMVNFFENNEMEIVIMTSNLTQLDFVGLTQAIWRSGRLQKGNTTTTSGKRFRLDLIRYLSKYKLSTTDLLLKKLENFDYSAVDVELVASAPGVYSMKEPKTKGETYGFMKLRQVLRRNSLLLDDKEVKHNLLAQVTSIAYPFSSRKGKTSSMFTHLLCPLMFTEWDQLLEPGAEASQEHQREFNYKPHIVFPTAKEIAGSNFGFLSGSAVHFKYTTSAIHEQQYEQNVKRYLCKWGHGSQTGREKVTPHVKYYACDNGDDWRSLRWVMVGSHNLSKQAWGYPLAKSKGTQFVVDSYELSVFKPGKETPLIPVYGSDVLPAKSTGVPVRFPFVVPPTPYLARDKAWSAEVDFGSLHDRWGNTHHGMF